MMIPVDIRIAATRLNFGNRAVSQRVGLLVLATDHTNEAGLPRMVAFMRPPG
jgi:hypothetical protein